MAKPRKIHRRDMNDEVWDFHLEQLLPWQKQVFKAVNNPYSNIDRIVCACSRRSGKTTLARTLIHTTALARKCNIGIIFPHLKQGRDILLRELQEDYFNHRAYFEKVYQNALEFYYVNGSYLKFYSMKEINAARGKKFQLILIDEAQEIDDLQALESAIDPCLAATKTFGSNLKPQPGRLVAFGTSKGPNAFKELCQRGRDKEKFVNWKTYVVKFDPKYLTHIPISEYEKIKAQTPKHVFDREYMCDFSSYSGVIYKEFNRDIHIVKNGSFPSDGIKRSVLGLDFGFNHPNAIAVLNQATNGDWYIVNEILKSNMTTQQLVDVLKPLIQQHHVKEIWCSPEANRGIADLKEHIKNVFISKTKTPKGSNNSNVLGGISIIQNLIHHDYTNLDRPVAPRLYIYERCVDTIKEFENYSYKDDKDIPIEINDDLMDALRYAIVSCETNKGTVGAGMGMSY